MISTVGDLISLWTQIDASSSLTRHDDIWIYSTSHSCHCSQLMHSVSVSEDDTFVFLSCMSMCLDLPWFLQGKCDRVWIKKKQIIALYPSSCVKSYYYLPLNHSTYSGCTCFRQSSQSWQWSCHTGTVQTADSQNQTSHRPQDKTVLLIRASQMEINVFLDVRDILYHFWRNNKTTRNHMYIYYWANSYCFTTPIRY